MINGLISKIIPFSAVDGPGNRTVIFLQGCNYNCLYCHNPETINICNDCGKCVSHCEFDSLIKENNKVKWNKDSCKNCGKCIEVCPNDSSPKTVRMSVKDVLREINKYRSFISGITVSGGECTLQHEFITELFKEVKKLGLTTFIDTNGSTPLYEFDELIKYMDMAMIDIKSFDLEENKMLTGIDNKNVMKNTKYLSKLNKLYEVRTVIVPQVLDNFKNVDEISRLIVKLNPSIRYKIIKYRSIGVRTELINSYTPSDEEIEKLTKIAINNGCKNVINV